MVDLPGLQAAIGDRYTIERELGRGGTALVFLARDRKLHDRLVALKVLRPDLAAALGSRRFLGEIETVAHLAHSHILMLHDSGEAGGFLYYVMPYMEGESLRDRLARERQLSIEDALQLTREVADALSYAHSHDVVHRDIKPENILLQAGHAVVADFGIATAISEASDRSGTSSRIVVGTPAYMSPEQGSGDPYVDGRSDIYSLGCVLYEMLAGHAPFTGVNAQEILARHSVDPVPSLRTARPSVPEGLERVIWKALAKVPADRFATASRFADALDKAGDGDVEPGRRWGRVATVSLLVAATAAAGWFGMQHAALLDANKVVVFPLVETPMGGGREGLGEDVALMIGSGLEHTEPLRWIDGWTLLDPRQRADLTQLTATAERRIARGRGARWYVDGSVVRRGDSATVVLRLNDVKGDSLVAGASATGVPPQAAQLGLQAVNQLLPHILAPGRQIDLTALAAARPAAVANWLQGEREYRRANFAGALEYLRRAVGADSALAVAALRGAQAATWMERYAEEGDLMRVALTHIDVLSPRQAQFARGLAAFLFGQPDSAVFWLTRALANSPDWTEAHMALGEVYYHLLPSNIAPLSSLAEREFRAAAADSGFTPPLFHLAEMAIRGGDVARARRAVQQFERSGLGPERVSELSLTLDCMQGGRRGVAWSSAVAAGPLVSLSAARSLAAVGGFWPCAEDGFRAVLAEQGAAAFHWGAFLGLQGVLAAEGRTSELRGLIDSLVAGGLETARRLYLLDACGGIGVQTQAAETATRYARQHGSQYVGASPQLRWLLGSWHAHIRDAATAETIQGTLAQEAARTGDPRTASLAAALRGQLAALQGDTATAIAALRSVVATGRREVLQWDLSEPFPPERLLLAKLLLARGEPQAAMVLATAFDQPSPVAFLPYLPASLVLRHRAAIAMGQSTVARQLRERLIALGQGKLIATHP